jgi:hypothetical protein
MMTSEPIARDFWSMRSDEAGTEASINYAFMSWACLRISQTIKVGTSKLGCFGLWFSGRVLSGLGLARRSCPRKAGQMPSQAV